MNEKNNRVRMLHLTPEEAAEIAAAEREDEQNGPVIRHSDEILAARIPLERIKGTEPEKNESSPHEVKQAEMFFRRLSASCLDYADAISRISYAFAVMKDPETVRVMGIEARRKIKGFLREVEEAAAAKNQGL